MSYRRATLAAAAGLFTGGAYLATNVESWIGSVYGPLVVVGVALVPRAQGAGWGRSVMTAAAMLAAVALLGVIAFYYELLGGYSPWFIYDMYYYWMEMLFALIHAPLAISLSAPLSGRASSWGRALLVVVAVALMFVVVFNQSSASPGGEVVFPGVPGDRIPAWWWAGLVAWAVLPALAGLMSRPTGGRA